MNALIIIYEHFEHRIVDFVLLSGIDTFRVVYNQSLSNLKNLNRKFPKNMIVTLIYSI